MKHIYKFSIVLLTVFTFIGCNVDDDDSVTVLPMKELTASLSQQVDVIRIADDATSYDLVINFSEALPSYSTIEYSLDGGATTTSSASSGFSISLRYCFNNFLRWVGFNSYKFLV